LTGLNRDAWTERLTGLNRDAWTERLTGMKPVALSEALIGFKREALVEALTMSQVVASESDNVIGELQLREQARGGVLILPPDHIVTTCSRVDSTYLVLLDRALTDKQKANLACSLTESWSEACVQLHDSISTIDKYLPTILIGVLSNAIWELIKTFLLPHGK